MAQHGWFRRLWLTRLSRPAGERVIYRHVLRTGPQRIVELGLGTLGRTERLLGLAASRQADGQLQYVGLDRVEGGVEHIPARCRSKRAILPRRLDHRPLAQRLLGHLGPLGIA